MDIGKFVEFYNALRYASIAYANVKADRENARNHRDWNIESLESRGGELHINLVTIIYERDGIDSVYCDFKYSEIAPFIEKDDLDEYYFNEGGEAFQAVKKAATQIRVEKVLAAQRKIVEDAAKRQKLKLDNEMLEYFRLKQKFEAPKT